MLLQKITTMGTARMLLLLFALQLLVIYWGLTIGLSDISPSALLGLSGGGQEDALTARIL
jgi:hypothetical protein